jgi:hypothetical protein
VKIELNFFLTQILMIVMMKTDAKRTLKKFHSEIILIVIIMKICVQKTTMYGEIIIPQNAEHSSDSVHTQARR